MSKMQFIATDDNKIPELRCSRCAKFIKPNCYDERFSDGKRRFLYEHHCMVWLTDEELDLIILEGKVKPHEIR